MEPKRMLVATEIAGLEVGQYVWLIAELDDDRALIELGERRREVPLAALAATPVPAPRERLLALDPCFEAPPDTLREVHSDDERLFRVLECRHGKLFLEDTVTGIGWYSRRLWLGDTAREPTAWRDFWQRHHRLSDDQIRLLRIGM